MNCPSCGNQIAKGSHYCTSCGDQTNIKSKISKQQHVKQINTQYISVLSCVGVVVGSQTWTDTHVSGGGTAGGYVLPSGAVIMHSRPISSNTIETNRFFVRQDNNSEKIVDLKGASFAVRDGHAVSIVCATSMNGGVGWDYYYYNHSTGNEYVDYGILNQLTRHIYDRKTGLGLMAIYTLFLGIPAWFLTDVLRAILWTRIDFSLIWLLLFIPMILIIIKRNDKAQKQLDYLMLKFVNDARQVLATR